MLSKFLKEVIKLILLLTKNNKSYKSEVQKYREKMGFNDYYPNPDEDSYGAIGIAIFFITILDAFLISNFTFAYIFGNFFTIFTFFGIGYAFDKILRLNYFIIGWSMVFLVLYN